jgi:maltose phosphorylase
VHSILAASIGRPEKAYEMYLRTSRLDLDDYNSDTADGLHITSMGGTWMSFVLGLGGMRVRNGEIHFNPILPKGWESYSFKINFKNTQLKVEVHLHETLITNLSEQETNICVFDKEELIEANSTVTIKL